MHTDFIGRIGYEIAIGADAAVEPLGAAQCSHERAVDRNKDCKIALPNPDVLPRMKMQMDGGRRLTTHDFRHVAKHITLFDALAGFDTDRGRVHVQVLICRAVFGFEFHRRVARHLGDDAIGNGHTLPLVILGCWRANVLSLMPRA